MKKYLITALTLLCVISVPIVADSNHKWSRAAPMKYVGTYFSNEGSVTFHSDGTMSNVTAEMFSDDPNNQTAGRKETPRRGVWRKVGRNKFQVTMISYVTEIVGHNYRPDGFILKVKWLAVFDRPVKGVSPGYTAVNIVAEGFLPDQNPLTDEPRFVLPQPDRGAYRLIAE